LIREGHTFSEIKGYSLSQILIFTDLIKNRYEMQNKAQDNDEKAKGKNVVPGTELLRMMKKKKAKINKNKKA
jgi:hypothetical protein